MKHFKKQPSDHLDYDVILDDWMTNDDEVMFVDIGVVPEGIEVTQIGVEPSRVKLWIKGGQSGQSYKLSPLIHTKNRIKEVDFLIIVTEM